MSEIVFYRQQRFDKAIRTGIEVNGARSLEYFTPGLAERNPALLWYIDVRLEGEELPSDVDAAREWLQRQIGFIQRGLTEAADQLQVGIDEDILPFRKALDGAPSGISANLIISGVRRLSDGEISSQVRETGEKWLLMLEQLRPLARV